MNITQALRERIQALVEKGDEHIAAAWNKAKELVGEPCPTLLAEFVPEFFWNETIRKERIAQGESVPDNMVRIVVVMSDHTGMTRSHAYAFVDEQGSLYRPDTIYKPVTTPSANLFQEGWQRFLTDKTVT